MTRQQKVKSAAKRKKLVRRPLVTVPEVVEIAAPAVLDTPPVRKSTGLAKFGFTRRPPEMPQQEVVVMRVNIGAPTATGVQLTALKEMAACPPSTLSRERVIAVNTGKHKEKQESKQDIEKRRSLVRMRIKENSIFIASYGGNRLWCMACKKVVDHSRGHAVEHLLTTRHLNNLKKDEKVIESSKRERDYIREYFLESHAKSETVDIDTLQFRFKTLYTFLTNGTALNKMGRFRSHFEETSGFTLTVSTHMRTYLPPLLRKEIDDILNDIRDQNLMVIFDGTTRVDEVFAIVFRYVTVGMQIEERLVEMGKYQHSFNHEELITAVVKILTKYDVDLGAAERGRIIRNGAVIGFQRDRCSVNAKAVTILTKNCMGSKDMECMSHTLTHVGEHLGVPLLLKTKQDVCALAKESYSLRSHWYKVTGKHFVHPGNTRWWAYYDLYEEIRSLWTCFITFVMTAVADGNVGESGSRIRRLSTTVNDPVSRTFLKLELDVVVISMKPFVETTYILEGKGPCAIVAY